MNNEQRVQPITGVDGQAFAYYCNVVTGVAHAGRSCAFKDLSNVVRDTNPGDGFIACGKCVPDKCKA